MDNEPNPDLSLITAEQATLHHLIDGIGEPQAIIPSDISDDLFWEYLNIISKTAQRVRVIDLRLRPLLGRMLLMAKNKPALYESHGYKNFEEFLTGLEALGLKRGTAYNAKQLAKNFPTLSPARFQRIGTENIRTLSRFTDESMPDCQRHLLVAEQLSVKEFTAYAENNGYINKGEADRYTIQIETTKEIGDAWNDYVNDVGVCKNCGSTDPGVILMHTMEEASTEMRGTPFVEKLPVSQKVRDAIDSLVNDSRVHRMTGSLEPEWNLLWALAKALDSVSERNVNARDNQID